MPELHRAAAARRDRHPGDTHGAWTPQGTVPAVLHRNVGAARVLHNARRPAALHHGHRARRPRPAGGRGQRDLRSLPGLRLLHAVHRRHGGGSFPGLPAGGAPGRRPDGRRALSDEHPGLRVLHGRPRPGGHRQRVLQAQHLGHGGQHLRARRSQARRRFQHLLHGDQHRCLRRQSSGGVGAQRARLAVDLPGRRHRHLRRPGHPAPQLEGARKGRPQARAQPRRRQLRHDRAQHPAARLRGRDPRLLPGQGLPAGLDPGAAGGRRLPRRHDPGDRLLRPPRPDRQRGRKARPAGPAPDLRRRRHLLHGPAPQRQRHDPVGPRLHGSPGRAGARGHQAGGIPAVLPQRRREHAQAGPAESARGR